MTPLSAIEAIDPAWRHTFRLMFRSGNRRLFLKIAAVAFFAQTGGFNLNTHSSGHPLQHLPPALAASLAALAVFFLIVGFCIWLVLFYVGSRLQLVLFDVVLRGDTTIGPIWRRLGPLTWRWIGFRFLALLVFLAALLPFAIPAIIVFFHTLKNHPGGHFNAGHAFLAFLGIFAGVVILVLILSTIYSVVEAFTLPSLVLENTSLGTAVGRVCRLFRAEPGQVLLFMLMRFLLGLAGVFVAYIVVAIAALLALIPFGGVGFIIWATLHKSGTAGYVVMALALIALGLLFLAFVFLAVMTLFGFIFTFLQAYTLFFLGGRYPLLGQLLVPPTPDPYGYPTPPLDPGPPPNPYAYLNTEPPVPPEV